MKFVTSQLMRKMISDVYKRQVYHTGDYGRINSGGRLVLIRRNDDIILLPPGEKISRVRTNEQITAINGVADGFITFSNNRLARLLELGAPEIIVRNAVSYTHLDVYKRQEYRAEIRMRRYINCLHLREAD